MTNDRSFALLGFTGIALIVAFFLPFIDLGGLISASGWTLVTSDGPWIPRILVGLVPVAGAVMAHGGFTKKKSAHATGLLFGLGVLGYLGFQVVRAFLATTGIGLWIVVAAAFIGIGASLVRR